MEDIRDIRRQLGLTQTEFADRLGLHQSTISRMERGDLALDKRTALAAKALLATRSPINGDCLAVGTAVTPLPATSTETDAASPGKSGEVSQRNQEAA